MAERQRPGEVRDAIVAYFEEINADASAAEVCAGVSAKLGRAVPASSVRSYLGLNTPDMFERVGRGRYALANQSARAPKTDTAESAPVAFEFGQASLYQADALDWLRAREPRSIHGVVTDPPYGLVEYTNAQQAKLRAGKGGVWRVPPSFDGHKRAPLPRFTTLSSAELDSLERFFREFGEALLPALVPGAHVVVAANPLVSHLVSYALGRAGLERRGEIVRLVQTMRGGDRPKNAHELYPDVSVMPRSMWEPWLLFRKPVEGTVAQNLAEWGTGGLRRVSDDLPFGDVIRSAPTNRRERTIAAHPSLKPQAFLRQVVRGVLPMEKGVVLDPFAGSGSTLAAAEAVGYQSIGVERDPAYIEVAKSSIKALSELKVQYPTV
ncbi:DNA-methyltransferase [Gordonia alkaliphila]|uniref:Methyltransferase n=1 Tax=Gordonia alkaliphila TaxID=1053547 RepID=A0ABP8YWN8_9ACTN